MNCLRVMNLLSAYIDRELSPDEQRRIGRHLAVCPSCRAEWQSLQEVKDSLSAMPSVGLPIGFWAELDGKLAAAEHESLFHEAFFEERGIGGAGAGTGIGTGIGTGADMGAGKWLSRRRLVPVGVVAATLMLLVGTQAFFNSGDSSTTIQLTNTSAAAPPAESQVIPVDSLLREHYRYAVSDPLAAGFSAEGQLALPGRLGAYLNRDFPANSGIAAGVVSASVSGGW